VFGDAVVCVVREVVGEIVGEVVRPVRRMGCRVDYVVEWYLGWGVSCHQVECGADYQMCLGDNDFPSRCGIDRVLVQMIY
jgi:hypothetical protein